MQTPVLLYKSGGLRGVFIALTCFPDVPPGGLSRISVARIK